MASDKESALGDERYERAAELRDKERRLLADRVTRMNDWARDHPSLAALAEEVIRLRAEVERLDRRETAAAQDAALAALDQEASFPEAGPPEASPPEAGPPGTRGPEAGLPEASPPGTSPPVAGAPEASHPEDVPADDRTAQADRPPRDNGAPDGGPPEDGAA